MGEGEAGAPMVVYQSETGWGMGRGGGCTCHSVIKHTLLHSGTLLIRETLLAPATPFLALRDKTVSSSLTQMVPPGCCGILKKAG